jgi:uncharacterized protein (DUF427 family)
MRMNPAPGFKKYPHHHVETRPSSARVRVTYGNEIIAESLDAVELHEDSGEGRKTVAPVVYYLPRNDVRMERLVRSSHRTHCPFKGDASYFSVVGGPENAVWSYEAPYDEMTAIQDRLAFYPDKFNIETS